MKVVMPRGRENETLDAKFDVMPYAGCDCLYGTVNKVANDQVGRDSSEW